MDEFKPNDSQQHLSRIRRGKSASCRRIIALLPIHLGQSSHGHMHIKGAADMNIKPLRVRLPVLHGSGQGDDVVNADEGWGF